MVLFLGSIASLCINIWHSTSVDAEDGNMVLAIAYGVIPVLFAAILSHGMVSDVVGPWPRRIIVGLFLLGMAMSITAVTTMMQPYGGFWGGLGIAVILDTSTLVALNIITTESSVAKQAERERGYEAEVAARLADREAGVRAAIEAESAAKLAASEADMRAEFSAAMAAREAAMEAELATATQELAAKYDAELAAVKRAAEAELAAAKREATAVIEANGRAQVEEAMAKLAAMEADMRAAMAAELAAEREKLATAKRPAVAAAKQPARRPAVTAKTVTALPAGDTATRDNEVLKLLRENPDLTGDDLHELMGISPRTGRRILQRLRDSKATSVATDGAATAEPVATDTATDGADTATAADTDGDVATATHSGHGHLVAVS